MFGSSGRGQRISTPPGRRPPPRPIARHRYPVPYEGEDSIVSDHLIADIALIVSGVAMVISGWDLSDRRRTLATILVAVGSLSAVAGCSLLVWRL